MNFEEAIKAHSAWKLKLSDYLKKPNGSIKAADVEVDNKCALGQWLYGEGLKYQELSSYAVLKAAHARFHKSAADVVRKADSGKPITEDMAIGNKSEFTQASSQVILAIMDMKKQATHAA